MHIYFHLICGAKNNHTVFKDIIIPHKDYWDSSCIHFVSLKFLFVFWFSLWSGKDGGKDSCGLTWLHAFPWFWSTSFRAVFPLAEEVCWPKAFFLFGWREARDNVGHPCPFTLCSKNPPTVFQVLLKGLEAGQWIAPHILICQVSV